MPSLPLTNRWYAQRYNVNNAWNFNATNRTLNNNNVNNTNQVGAVTNLRNYAYMTDEQLFAILLHTMRSARRSKRYGRDCAEFERDWAAGLVRMTRQMQEKSFRVDRNYAFLTSVPKWREIFATSFEGRIADHLLCDTLLPYMEKELHPRTFNNRKGMGAQAAINRVIEDIYEVSEGYTRPCRVIKWDLKGFFPNALCDEIERLFRAVIDKNAKDITSDFDEDMPAFLKWLTMVCVHSNPAEHCALRTPRHFWREHIAPGKSLFGKPEGVGTPIGRLTSQMGMGLYMNDIVRWLNDGCGIRATLFMDDCVMVVPERLHGYALALFHVLRQKLAAKGIRLNERKFYDQPYEHGLEFLGSHIIPGRIHLNNKSYGNAVDKVRAANADVLKLLHLDNFVSSINSYTGLLKLRTDYGRIQRLRAMIGPEWYDYVDWDERRLCLRYKAGWSIPDRLKRNYNLKTHKRCA